VTSVFEGRTRRFSDHVNTDYIISSARKRETLDVAVLKQFLFEAIDPAFAASVRDGDVIVAGRNFGCGSAMEIAATVILGAGIPVVLAETFSRTFYRNAINNGLVPVECDTAGMAEGDRLAVRLSDAGAEVTNRRTGRVVAGAALPGIMREILASGGLVGYLRSHGRFRV
jgi:3-isopropylmalate/(R)-2-methylmalate dehydratase small subunit